MIILAGDFLAAFFFAAVFFTAFLAGDFLTAFLAGDFLTAFFFAAVFLAGFFVLNDFPNYPNYKYEKIGIGPTGFSISTKFRLNGLSRATKCAV